MHIQLSHREHKSIHFFYVGYTLLNDNLYVLNLKQSLPFVGKFHGFDKDQFTASSGGKAQVMDHLKQTFGYQKLVMVGDGATDMEASPPAVSLFSCEYKKNIKSQYQVVTFLTHTNTFIWINSKGEWMVFYPVTSLQV